MSIDTIVMMEEQGSPLGSEEELRFHGISPTARNGRIPQIVTKSLRECRSSRWEAVCGQMPLTTGLDDVENGVELGAQWGAEAAPTLSRRQQRFRPGPLGHSEIGAVSGDFRRLKCAVAEVGARPQREQPPPKRNFAHLSSRVLSPILLYPIPTLFRMGFKWSSRRAIIGDGFGFSAAFALGMAQMSFAAVGGQVKGGQPAFCFAASGLLTVTNYVRFPALTTNVEVVAFSIERRGDHWRLDATNSIRTREGGIAGLRWLTGSYEGTDVVTIARLAPVTETNSHTPEFTQRQASVINGGIPTFEPDLRVLWQAYLMPVGLSAVTNLPPPWPAPPREMVRVSVSYDDPDGGLPKSIVYHAGLATTPYEAGEYTVHQTREQKGFRIPTVFSMTQWTKGDRTRVKRVVWGGLSSLRMCGTSPLTPQLGSTVPTIDYRFADQSKAVPEFIYTNRGFLPKNDSQLQEEVKNRIAKARFGQRMTAEASRPLQIVFTILVGIVLLVPPVMLLKRHLRSKRSASHKKQH